jgi:hypothetical protein
MRNGFVQGNAGSYVVKKDEFLMLSGLDGLGLLVLKLRINRERWP